MFNRLVMLSPIAALALIPVIASANHGDHGQRCTTIDDADLVEVPGGDACPTDHPNCFTGKLSGHDGAHATTLFFGTSGAPGPTGSPGWFEYSGETQYHFRHGTLFMHETGLGTSDPNLPAITSAVEIITGGDGDLTGATGTLFVNGFNGEDSVVTVVRGTYCVPRGEHDRDDD